MRVVYLRQVDTTIENCDTKLCRKLECRVSG